MAPAAESDESSGAAAKWSRTFRAALAHAPPGECRSPQPCNRSRADSTVRIDTKPGPMPLSRLAAGTGNAAVAFYWPRALPGEEAGTPTMLTDWHVLDPSNSNTQYFAPMKLGMSEVS